ncbi:MAG: ankyrin repeat domain-containing protein, partial [Proteobacteria bacterium]|nr:ankyrin repeat domain-containing protein [Pseudomonadota bacterium]MBU1688188.1 ankyrin repeat domain-containing protein [Pseudomonadota bacterium]
MKISMDGKKRNKKRLKIQLPLLIWFLIAIFISGCAPPAYIQAIKNHDVEFMEKYINEGNELSSSSSSKWLPPLMVAAQLNDINIARLLIEKGADVNGVNRLGQTALHYAKTGEMTQLLLKAGADVNVSSKWGETPLHWAKTGEIVKLLLEAGAELNGLTKLGETPLDVAYYANSK